MSWPIAPLGHVAASVDYGLTASASEVPDGPKFLRITDIQDDHVDWNCVPYCNATNSDEVANKLLPGDIVFARTGATTGKSYLIRSCPERAVFASYLIRVRPSDKLDSLYLSHFFQSENYWAQIRKNARGAAQPGVNSTVLRELLIPLPPLDEQRRIAAILDQADDLRRKRRETLQRAHKLQLATFYETFGDPITNPMRWPQHKCVNLCHRIAVGIVVKPASYYEQQGVAAIRGLNIKPTGIDLSDCVYISDASNKKLSSSRVWTDDIVLVRSGRPGLAAVIPNELNGVNSIDIIIATPNKDRVRPRFFRDFINSPGGKKIVLAESRGQVQQHFNLGSMSEAEIFAPPPILQQDYEAKLDAIEKHIARLNEARNKVDTLFASLQYRAFRGEL